MRAREYVGVRILVLVLVLVLVLEICRNYGDKKHVATYDATCHIDVKQRRGCLAGFSCLSSYLENRIELQAGFFYLLLVKRNVSRETNEMEYGND